MTGFTLTESKIDENELKASIEDERAGAISTFEGRVRNHNEGKPVTRLAYEACESLCESEAIKILAEAKEQFQILHAVVSHRTGVIEIGELAVFVGVSSAHRDAAFKACRYIIDEIKARLPIWKKETYVDGESVWVNCQTCGTGSHSKSVDLHRQHEAVKP